MNTPPSRIQSSYHDVDELYRRNRIVLRRMDDPYVGPPFEKAKMITEVDVIPSYDQNDNYRQALRRKISPANDAICERYSYTGQRNARSNCDQGAFGYNSDMKGQDTRNPYDTSTRQTYGTSYLKNESYMQYPLRRPAEGNERPYVRYEARIRPTEHFTKEHSDDAKHLRAIRPSLTPRAIHWPHERNAVEANGTSMPQSIGSGRGNTVEVSPGEFLRLRSTKETWDAFLNDFYMPCVCVCCDITLFCIQDACCVVCPACREISPLEATEPEGGVGLGFTTETLATWQDEIRRMRQHDHSV